MRSALDESSVFAEDKLEGLAKLLGIDAMRARLDYQDFARGEVEPNDVKVKYVGSLSADGQATDQPQADENSPKTLAELMLPQIRKLMKTKPQTALVMALSTGLHEEVREALASGANIHDPDPLYGETPLAAAISSGMIETVKALLKGGADVNRVGANGSPLHVAIGTGNLAVVRLLLDSGADPNQRGKFGVTPFMIASGMGAGIFGSTELVDLLLQRGADFHAKDDARGTALDMSAHAVAMLEVSLAQPGHASAESDSFRQMLHRVLEVREFLQAYEKAHAKSETP